MSASLVGSEMCIRDSPSAQLPHQVVRGSRCCEDCARQGRGRDLYRQAQPAGPAGGSLLEFACA
eukprot:3412340-Alexandrium_andersonii.AAC.1